MIATLSKIGHTENDSDELLIQKSFLVYLAIFMSVGGIVWGAICLYYGLQFQAIFPLSYVAVSVVNMLILNFTKNIKIPRFIQVLISLALPFLFQWSLGGFSASGSIMLWSILALIASLTFQSTSQATGWLAMFLTLTLASALMDERLKAFKPDILPDNSIMFVVLNMMLICTIVFGLVVYFVNKYKEAEVKLEKERDNLRRSNLHLRKSYSTLRNSYQRIKSSLPPKKAADSEGRVSDNDLLTQEMHLKELEEILRAQKRLIDKNKE
jgi:glucan phosphoethanolaminetransferase (alkaline phosphatase superfamily)